MDTLEGVNIYKFTNKKGVPGEDIIWYYFVDQGILRAMAQAREFEKAHNIEVKNNINYVIEFDYKDVQEIPITVGERLPID